MTQAGPFPVIDLDALEISPAARAAVLRDLHAAAHGTGAFLLAGSGIDPARAQTVLELSRRVFRLPGADLDAIDMLHSRHFRGYNRAGSEVTLGRADMREQLDVAPETPPDARAGAGPPYWRLPGPNQWPADLPELRPAILGWMDHLHGVAERLLDALLVALDAPRDAFAGAFAPGAFTRLKIVRYPGLPPAADLQGVGEHRDSGLLTLILDDGAGGLQVASGEQFFEVPSRPGALIVVLGRTLERATQGYVAAARHRVSSPPPGGERVSIPYFFSPRLDYVVRQVELAPALLAQASPLALDDADLSSTEFGHSALNTLLRSHPEVARRHHPDLTFQGAAR